MLSDETRKKLGHIIRGESIESEGDSCAAARNYLCSRFSTSPVVKSQFESQSIIKKEQVEALKIFATSQGCWFNDISLFGQYIGHGSESIVYLSPDNTHVVKLNDAVYYATWLEYLNSLVIHNLIFPDTAYTLLGFTESGGELKSVVRQSYIIADSLTPLENIRRHLAYNGFEKKIREDYFNKEYGLLLEDMHDENVLTRNDFLFFIDTVFYLVDAEKHQ